MEAVHLGEPGDRAVRELLVVPLVRGLRGVLDVLRVLEVPLGHHVLGVQQGHREVRVDRVGREVQEVLEVL